MSNPCAVSAECLQRLLDFYRSACEEPDAVLVATSEQCVVELLRPLSCEELLDLEPHIGNAKRILEGATNG